ncbi:MAG TPA: DUF1460 domain-containing protein [Ignavibacteria bacterium]|nr:DUF1460 domain-containing protein [Bacteroidota bacterium]HRI85875.1 DUF1460 domain-containing protein [Ignavibacteria bacterium]HRJ98149.1 DUF1460 domain-containing protein [Ignavibacteria bacterium]
MNLLNRHNLLSIITIASVILFSLGFNSSPADDYEEMKCRKKLKSFDASLKNLPLNDVIAEVGKSFIGTPYVAGTLDEYPNTEELVINVTGLDCVTFVENALIFSRLIKSGKTDFDNYKKELELIRYRGGKNTGYSSRLHYFIDWIYDNEKKGIVKDITPELGGVSIGKDIDFMTSHRNSYKQLKNNDILLGEMYEVENNINSRDIYYIPTENISSVYDRLQTGDIVGITTSIGGLDIAHTGFIYKEGGSTYLMHASLKNKKVEISGMELHDYIMGNSKQTGIVVARVLE